MSDMAAYPATLPLGNPWHDSKSPVRAAHHEATRRMCRRRDRLHRQRRPDMKDDQELGNKVQIAPECAEPCSSRGRSRTQTYNMG
jgi:hypothetical protein